MKDYIRIQPWLYRRPGKKGVEDERFDGPRGMNSSTASWAIDESGSAGPAQREPAQLDEWFAR